MWTIRQIMSFIRFAAPHVGRLIVSSLVQAFWLVTLAITSAFRGANIHTQIAEHWLEEALAHGFPGIWERQLRTTFNVLSVLTILLGWAIILFTTYITVDWGYQLLTQP